MQAQKLEPFILKNRHGVEAHILPYGAIVQKLTVPDRSGRPTDVVLGFDSLTPYQVTHSVLHDPVFLHHASRLYLLTYLDLHLVCKLLF